MGKSKSPAPTPPPAPVTTPQAQKPVEPIQRTATSAAALDRAQNNKSADLMATDEDDPAKKAGGGQAGMMG